MLSAFLRLSLLARARVNKFHDKLHPRIPFYVSHVQLTFQLTFQRDSRENMNIHRAPVFLGGPPVPASASSQLHGTPLESEAPHESHETRRLFWIFNSRSTSHLPLDARGVWLPPRISSGTKARRMNRTPARPASPPVNSRFVLSINSSRPTSHPDPPLLGDRATAVSLPRPPPARHRRRAHGTRPAKLPLRAQTRSASTLPTAAEELVGTRAPTATAASLISALRSEERASARGRELSARPAGRSDRPLSALSACLGVSGRRRQPPFDYAT